MGFVGKTSRLVWLVPLLAGCESGSAEELMPLRVGAVERYLVRAGFENFVEPVSVRRRVPVMDVEGFELAGPLGVSRLAWRGGRLLLAQGAGARLTPPAPLLAPGGSARWRGWIETNGETLPAAGLLTVRSERLRVGGAPVPANRSTLRLRTPRREYVLDSWFRAGVGLVRQEQRTDGRLVLQLERLD